MPANPRSLRLLRTYHDRVAGTAEQISQALEKRLAQANPDELSESLSLAVSDAVSAVSIGQSAVLNLTRGFFRGLSQAETGTPELADTEVTPGKTTDGRDLTEVLQATVARTLASVRDGKPPAKALDEAARSIRRFAMTEVMDAARAEMQAQMDASDSVKGWRWASRGTCGACLALDNGSIRDGALQAHPNCLCVPEPVFDVKEKVKRETGRERFLSLSVEAQDELLGDKADLVRRNLIPWTALVEFVRHPEWHDHIKEAPLGALLERAGLNAAEGSS